MTNSTIIVDNILNFFDKSLNVISDNRLAFKKSIDSIAMYIISDGVTIFYNIDKNNLIDFVNNLKTKFKLTIDLLNVLTDLPINEVISISISKSYVSYNYTNININFLLTLTVDDIDVEFNSVNATMRRLFMLARKYDSNIKIKNIDKYYHGFIINDIKVVY